MFFAVYFQKCAALESLMLLEGKMNDSFPCRGHHSTTPLQHHTLHYSQFQ